MAIKSGNIIHVGNGAVLVDRLQTGGPGSVNIRREQIYELGNYKSVGQVSDIPDLSFSMESFDVSCAMEALLLDVDVKTTHQYDLAQSKKLNVKSAFKPGVNAASPYATASSAAIPCLTLESVSYRFGIGNNNARQTATLRGDSLYYNPGSTYIQKVAGSGTAGQVIVTTNPAYAITEGGVTRRTLAITAGEKRLLYGTDYTETYGTVTAGAAITTITITAAVAVTDQIYVTYASPTVESFPQSVHALVSGVSGTLAAASLVGATTLSLSTAPAVGDVIIIDDTPGSATVETAVVSAVSGAGPYSVTVPALAFAHNSGAPFAVYVPTVKPAAIRGRDIDVYIGPAFPAGTSYSTALGTKRHGVQSVQSDWRVTLQNDEEFGNYHYVATDFDVPSSTGNIQFKPADAAAVLALMQDLAGAPDALHSANASDAPPLDVQILLKNPVDGRVLKRLRIPDARFSLPGYSGRVQQKLDFTANYQSDLGSLEIYDH